MENNTLSDVSYDDPLEKKTKHIEPFANVKNEVNSQNKKEKKLKFIKQNDNEHVIIKNTTEDDYFKVNKNHIIIGLLLLLSASLVGNIYARRKIN